MLIDLILDRKDGEQYNAKDFYLACLDYEQDFNYGISKIMDEGSEDDVRKKLCEYVINNDYNTEICNYINSVQWLVND